MTVATVEKFVPFGPEVTESVTVGDARAWCREVAVAGFEHCSAMRHVLSPPMLDDFLVLWTLGAWADALPVGPGGAEARAAVALRLDAMRAGTPDHRLFVALRAAVEPFAGEAAVAQYLDATLTGAASGRYATWDDLFATVHARAAPMATLALGVLGESDAPEPVRASMTEVMAIVDLCHRWEAVGSDYRATGHLHLPLESFEAPDFEARLDASARAGFGVDATFLREARAAVRAGVDRTVARLDGARVWEGPARQRSRRVAWLLLTDAGYRLRQIGQWHDETALHWPRFGRLYRSWLTWATRRTMRREDRRA